MNDYNCKYGEIRKQGITQGIYCSIIKGWCVKMRFCPTKNSVEYTNEAPSCPANPDNKK